MSALEPAAMGGLLALGAVHGVNPGMGWLFAVALGLQEKQGRAVWRALPPLALGHAGAIVLAVAVAALAGELIPPHCLRYTVALLLLGLGLHRLRRGHMHSRLAGMRVSWRQLTSWSFLMASAHGAGLMVVPLLLGGASAAAGADPEHASAGAHVHGSAVLEAGTSAGQAAALLASGVHALGYLAVTALIALVVYHRLGLRLLRTAWINLDAVWAIALIATGLLTALA